MDAVIMNSLLAAGIDKNDITFDAHCTSCSSKHFSYRRGDRDQRIMVAVEKVS